METHTHTHTQLFIPYTHRARACRVVVAAAAAAAVVVAHNVWGGDGGGTLGEHISQSQSARARTHARAGSRATRERRLD